MCSCNNTSNHGQTSCSCHEKKRNRISRGIGCFQGCEPPEQLNPLCAAKQKKALCFEEEICEEETFDASQIRYRSGCQDREESPLVNINIGIGDNFEHIIDTLGKRVMDISYLKYPHLPGHPELDTIEKQITFLLDKTLALEFLFLQQKIRIEHLENNQTHGC
jgi:hypothetical protein